MLCLCAAKPLPAAGDAVVELEAIPQVCIVDRRNPDCEMKFEVRWRTPARMSVCLSDDRSDTPLMCWEDQDHGVYRQVRTVDRSFRFLLQNSDGVTLAEKRIEVLNADSADRRRQRRRRNVWSIL